MIHPCYYLDNSATKWKHIRSARPTGPCYRDCLRGFRTHAVQAPVLCGSTAANMPPRRPWRNRIDRNQNVVNLPRPSQDNRSLPPTKVFAEPQRTARLKPRKRERVNKTEYNWTEFIRIRQLWSIGRKVCALETLWLTWTELRIDRRPRTEMTRAAGASRRLSVHPPPPIVFTHRLDWSCTWNQRLKYNFKGPGTMRKKYGSHALRWAPTGLLRHHNVLF